MVFNLANYHALDEVAWTTVTPGTKVAMLMVVRKLLNSASNLMVVQCPERICSGTWATDETGSWVKWFVRNVSGEGHLSRGGGNFGSEYERLDTPTKIK